MSAALEDTHGRSVSYMRVSVTDRCNLRCTYCAGEGVNFIPHPNILRYEEILELISLAKSLGVAKVRFTGGEPFVRKGFGEFMVDAARQYPDLDLCVTTNATLIGEHIDNFVQAGIKRLNISLDTMVPEKYAAITGRDLYATVIENINRCLDADMTVKINAVAMRGFNDSELPAFMEFATENRVDFRFIEFMPVGLETGWKDDLVWKAEDILEEAGKIVKLTPVTQPGERRNGPARMFAIEGGKGRVGLISPYTNHFCATCNRLRITSDGVLRTCLFSDKVYKLRDALRHPNLGIKAVERIVRAASRRKPIGHELLERMPAGKGGVCRTRMASIGG
ncbi:GTP 3',8-cyclase MoaA [Pseudodesulfovibrio sediminis]|uniref:GTP 3',8-cyclase n=1 Tax=Pseudodesulfovibrio sediminis TaxID=2810563 RepID=A0ABN6EWQ5_9BACT|nr:GTP 3',8-cyclase MoaA [Pseudodesulfovibrio sediminis]BCS89704.1 cyclic pyranopterin monophosphate synthase [Pseudodesulfovibrio sediminis]